MNTYRIIITTMRGGDVGTQVCEFDVDALRPLTATKHALKWIPGTQFDTDLITITSQLYAKDIFPPNEQNIRQVSA